MRRRLLTRTIIVFALILSILVCTIPEDAVRAATVTNEKVQKVLKKKIKNKLCKYAFADLDKDGLDELITYQYQGPDWYDNGDAFFYVYIIIYRYSDGKAKKILSKRYFRYNGNEISFELYYKDTCYLKVFDDSVYNLDKYAYYEFSKDKGTFRGLCYKNIVATGPSYFSRGWKSVSEKKFNKIMKKFPGDDSKLEIEMELSDKELAKKFVEEYLTEMIPELSEGKESVTSEIKDFNGDGFADLKLKDASGESIIYSLDFESDSLSLLQYTDSVTDDPDDSEEVREYVKENYPGLIKLADEGLISFSAEYERDTVKLGSWDMEYWEKNGEGEKAKEVLVTDGNKEDMEWYILGYSGDGQYAYCLSKYILFNKQFNETRAKLNFSESTLCQYLNTDFYENAFTESEKELIGDSSANSRNFKVIIMTTKDLRLYYDYELEINTKERIATYIDGRAGSWWTRTHGLKYNDDYESYSSSVQSLKRMVLSNGSIEGVKNAYNEESNVGISVVSSCGVRPFITIRLTPEFIEANNLSVGNAKPKLKKVYVVFGTRNTSETNSIPMEWDILDYNEESGKTLLASRYIEASIAYDDKSDIEETSWKDCTLRSWLNSKFYDSAFDEKEKALIAANKYSEGEDLEDNVFILSYSEVEKYYPITDKFSVYDRICALRNGASREWWLRTPDEESGITSSTVALVSVLGGLCYADAKYEAKEGVCEADIIFDDWNFSIYDHTVRPAIYIKLK